MDFNFDLRVDFPQPLHKVVGKRIVVIDQENQFSIAFRVDLDANFVV